MPVTETWTLDKQAYQKGLKYAIKKFETCLTTCPKYAKLNKVMSHGPINYFKINHLVRIKALLLFYYKNVCFCMKKKTEQCSSSLKCAIFILVPCTKLLCFPFTFFFDQTTWILFILLHELTFGDFYFKGFLDHILISSP